MENLVIKGVECRLNENGVVELNLEHVARGLGFTQIAKSGNEVVRWETVRSYLQGFGIIPTSWDGFPPQMGERGLPDFIPENIFYKLCFKAKNEIAKSFQDLVTDEILPSIRKHGAYMTQGVFDNMISNPDFGIQLLNSLKEEQIKRAVAEKKTVQFERLVHDQDEMLEARSKHIRQMIPSVTFANAVKTSDRSILIGELARIIKQNGVEIGQNRLFAWMRERGYLIKSTESYNQPTQKAMNMGLFEIKKVVIDKPDGTTLATTTTKVTGKGQIYFVNKFLYEDANRQGAEFQKKLEAEMKGGAL